MKWDGVMVSQLLFYIRTPHRGKDGVSSLQRFAQNASRFDNRRHERPLADTDENASRPRRRGKPISSNVNRHAS